MLITVHNMTVFQILVCFRSLIDNMSIYIYVIFLIIHFYHGRKVDIEWIVRTFYGLLTPTILSFEVVDGGLKYVRYQLDNET